MKIEELFEIMPFEDVNKLVERFGGERIHIPELNSFLKELGYSDKEILELKKRYL